MMLRFKADLRSLAFVGFYYLLLAGEWNLVPTHSWVAVPLLLLTCVVSFLCAIITHNTLHSPVFTSRLWNKMFQVALSCAYGFPVSEYVPGHNLSHHKHTQKRADLMRTSKAPFRINILNAAYFFPRVASDIFFQNYRYVEVMKAQMPRWHRQLLIEIAFVWGAKAGLLLLDWRKALLFVVVPHLFAVWGITSVNFLQHDGCDQDHPYNHSRNFVGRAFNWLTFNNGFHCIHHDQPGLHWSLTAQAHQQRIHGRIHPALEQQSLAIYLFRTFLFPGQRLRYDGKPVVLPPEGPDQEWIPASISSAIQDLGAEGTAMTG